jgi:hypothetical protein
MVAWVIIVCVGGWGAHVGNRPGHPQHNPAEIGGDGHLGLLWEATTVGIRHGEHLRPFGDLQVWNSCRMDFSQLSETFWAKAEFVRILSDPTGPMWQKMFHVQATHGCKNNAQKTVAKTKCRRLSQKHGAD